MKKLVVLLMVSMFIFAIATSVLANPWMWRIQTPVKNCATLIDTSDKSEKIMDRLFDS